MSVQRRGGRWAARWRDGDGRSCLKTFDRREDAVEHDRRVNLRRSTTSSALLSVWAAVWFETHGPSWARTTYANRQQLWRKHIEPHLGAVKLSRLTRSAVRAYRAKLVDLAVPTSQVNDAVGCLRAMLSAAVDDEVIEINPAWRIKPLREKRSSVLVFEVLHIEQLRMRLRPGRDRLAVGLMAYAGLRPEEVWALPWSNVTPEALVIDRAWTGLELKELKAGDARVVPLAQVLRDELLESRFGSDSLLVCPPPRAAFTSHRNWVRRVWHPALLAAKLDADYDPYDLRHTYASLLVHEGITLPEVARRLGHSSPATTLKHYTHVIELARLRPRVPLDATVAAARKQLGLDVDQKWTGERGHTLRNRSRRRISG